MRTRLHRTITKWLPIIFSLGSLIISTLAFNRTLITQRAYIDVDIRIEPIPTNADLVTLVANLKVAGNSPAHDIQAAVKCDGFVITGENPIIVMKGLHKIPGEVITFARCLAPKKVLRKGVIPSSEFFEPSALMRGTVTYKDELKISHYKNFCFTYDSLTGIHPCENGNDAN